MLGEEQQRAAAKHDAPLLRFRAIGICSVGFAFEHPEWFKLMNTARYQDHSDPEVRAQLEENARALEGLLTTSVQEGGIDTRHDRGSIMLAVQALTYGLTRMFLDGHLDASPLDRRRIEELAETVLNLLATGFLDSRP